MTLLIDPRKREIPVVVDGAFYLDQPRRPWLVNGMIREGTTAFLSAREGTGKSFVALELAYCIAEGHQFFGNDVSKGDVLYVAAERGDAQRERLEALRDLKGYTPSSVKFLDYGFKLNVAEDEELLHASIERVGIRPKLIIIDTLRASFEGDENSSANAQATMDAVNRLRKQYDATVLVLHHVNGFGKSRGSSAFIGSADTELYMSTSRSKKARKVYLTVRKQNNGPRWAKYVLTPQQIDFGKDYSSIVFNLDGVQEVEQSPVEDEESSEREQNILDALEQAGGTLTSLRALQDVLQQIEGTLPNRDSLKRDLELMVGKELVVMGASGANARGVESSKRISISLPEAE